MPTITEILLQMNRRVSDRKLTLGDYRNLACTCFGNNSGAVQFIDENIVKSEKGEKEIVSAPEGQMIYLLSEFHRMWESV